MKKKTPMFATKLHLSRRSFLRGAGALLALPWLDAMVPAFANAAEKTAATASPRRFVAIHYGLGFHTPYLFPKTAGAGYELTPYLEELREHRPDFSVLSGVSHPEQRGANGHTSEMTWLTGGKHPGLPGFKNTISLDQYIAEKLNPDTRFPFLTLSVNGGDSLAWTANGVNLPSQSSPSSVFKQLFVSGSANEMKEQVRDLKRGRSILDTVNGEAKKLQRELGRRDQEKMDQYLTAVRDLEARIQQSEGWVNRPKPKVDVKPPTDIPDRTEIIGRTRLMHQLMLLALQTDSTRLITYKAGGMNAVPKIEGVDTDWHQLSHHGLDPAKIAELKRIETAEFHEINRFMGMLKGIQEPSGNLLDRTIILAGSNLGNASSHSTQNMPLILAGGGFRHGQHIMHDYEKNTPLCNLFVQIANQMQVETEHFGSSTTNELKGLAAA